MLVFLAGLQTEEPSQNSTGNVALIDLGTGTYQGFEGGLYPGGVNTPPADHLQSTLEEARLIQPLGPSGEPDPQRGLIVLLSIGPSNTAHEFAQFERQEDANPLRNPRLVLVNGGQAGQSSDAIDDPAASYWELLESRLAALELSPAQVQVVWLRQHRAPAFHAAKARSRGEPREQGERAPKTFRTPPTCCATSWCRSPGSCASASRTCGCATSPSGPSMATRASSPRPTRPASPSSG